MMLTPDELQAKIYKEQIEKHMKPGNVLMFAHGFNIHFNQIIPSKDLSAFGFYPYEKWGSDRTGISLGTEHTGG